METQKGRLRVARALVDDGHAQALVALEIVDVRRRVGKAGQQRKALVRGAQGFDRHRSLLSFGAGVAPHSSGATSRTCSENHQR